MSGEEVRNKKSESLGSEVQDRDGGCKYSGIINFVTAVLDRVGPTGETFYVPDHTDG